MLILLYLHKYTYSRCKIGCGWVWTGVHGCLWVCMGAIGLGDTEKQKSTVSKDTDGLGGDVFGPCMAGKFPGKHTKCAPMHKRGIRDSGGWAWVRMGAGGCSGIQQTQNKTNRDTIRPAWHNFDKCVGGQIGGQGCRGRHMTATDHIGEYGVYEGCPGTTQTCMYGVRCISARKNKKKKQNKQNIRPLQKCQNA